MKRYTNIIFWLIAVVLTTSGCGAVQPATVLEQAAPIIADGMVYPLGLNSTLWGWQQVANGVHTTLLMNLPGTMKFLAYWPTAQGWGFSGVDLANVSVNNAINVVCPGGNYANCKTAGDLASGLQANGWQFVTAEALPTWFVAAMNTASEVARTLASTPGLILGAAPEGAWSISEDILTDFYQNTVE